MENPMRSRLAHWSRQLCDSIICVPPRTPLRHRQRGQAASRPHAMTLVLGWGSALTAGILLTWFVSIPGPMAAQATLFPTQAEVATAAATAPQVTVEQATFG